MDLWFGSVPVQVPRPKDLNQPPPRTDPGGCGSNTQTYTIIASGRKPQEANHGHEEHTVWLYAIVSHCMAAPVPSILAWNACEGRFPLRDPSFPSQFGPPLRVDYYYCSCRRGFLDEPPKNIVIITLPPTRDSSFFRHPHTHTRTHARSSV